MRILRWADDLRSPRGPEESEVLVREEESWALELEKTERGQKMPGSGERGRRPPEAREAGGLQPLEEVRKQALPESFQKNGSANNLTLTQRD